MAAEPPPRKDVFAHVPFRLFRSDPSSFLRRRLQPELYLSADDVRGASPAEAESVARTLESAGLACTIHAPFHDLNPGAIDEDVRLLTLARHRSVLGLAAILRPRAIVFHAGWDRCRYDGVVDRWLRGSVRTWEELLRDAEQLPDGTRLLLENIFDEDPTPLAALLDRVPHPRMGFCLDTGHLRLFGRVPLGEWLLHLGHLMGEMHIHDNDGSRDQHLPPGEGSFPFDDLLVWLRGRAGRRSEVLLTLEAHTESELDRSLEWLFRRFDGEHGPDARSEST